MFPYIEECRRIVLEKLEGILIVPFETRLGYSIDNLCDLEIGHIEYQLFNNSNMRNTDLRRLISILRDIRNDLSHLRTLLPETLLCKELKEISTILKVEL